MARGIPSSECVYGSERAQRERAKRERKMQKMEEKARKRLERCSNGDVAEHRTLAKKLKNCKDNGDIFAVDFFTRHGRFQRPEERPGGVGSTYKKLRDHLSKHPKDADAQRKLNDYLDRMAESRPVYKTYHFAEGE